MGLIQRNYLSEIEYIAELQKRTDCVTCSGTPECPKCGSKEQCAMSTQTCSSCPSTYCSPITSSSSYDSNAGSSSNAGKIGGIAGGASAAVIIILIVGIFFLYKKWYKKKYPHGFFYYYDDEEDEQDKESLVEEHGHTLVQRRLSTSSNATGGGVSVFTKASNILNVAYIPGVTVRNPRVKKSDLSSNSNRALSIFSKETFFSDLDEASINGGHVAVRGATPVLVKVEEDSYNYDDPDDNKNGYSSDVESNKPKDNSNNNTTNGNNNNYSNVLKVTKSGYRPGLQQQFVIEEEDEEEDESILSTREGSSFANTSKKTDLATTPTSTQYSPLTLKTTPQPLDDSDSDTGSDSDLGDSDEENIEYLTTQLQQGNLNLDKRRMSLPFNKSEHIQQQKKIEEREQEQQHEKQKKQGKLSISAFRGIGLKSEPSTPTAHESNIIGAHSNNSRLSVGSGNHIIHEDIPLHVLSENEEDSDEEVLLDLGIEGKTGVQQLKGPIDRFE